MPIPKSIADAAMSAKVSADKSHVCPVCQTPLDNLKPGVELIEAIKREANTLPVTEKLYDALAAFMEPMRRYTKHSTWLKGDEDLLINAYEQAREAIALYEAKGEKP